LEALRPQFPVFNFNNSPRIIAQAKETAANGGTSRTNAVGTNAPVPVPQGNQPTGR
jgi:hypothetical protein